MWKPFVIFALIALFIAGGLYGFKFAARTGLPKVLPPPLKDEDEEEDR